MVHEIVKYIIEAWFAAKTSEPCLFVGESKDGQDVYIMVYVDDIIIASKSNEACGEIVTAMRKSFELSTTDDAYFFLGIQIERKRDERKLWISQQAYVEKMLRRFNLDKRNPKIPMEKGISMTKASDKEIIGAQDLPYRELVGSLMYLACTSRPDIMYAAAHIARYVGNYGRRHWNAAKIIAKYVSSTRYYRMCYGADENDITGYSYASWADDVSTRKSTGGLV